MITQLLHNEDRHFPFSPYTQLCRLRRGCCLNYLRPSSTCSLLSLTCGDEQKEKEKMASSADKPLEGNLQGFKICYVQGDLFSCPEKDALAHCISEDCDMEAGIAVWFKWKYGGVEELQNQKKKIGDVAVLKKDQRCIYYLITKKLASDKPTYDAVQKSLKAMRDHCLANGILKISMPKIGCGLDNLEWDKVSAIIEEVFKSTSIVITVYSL
ncbi:ADP-ribose glycohydrolase OARD1-like isoform X3 [Hypanus sabinus]|uniref:ADP-ribose glycohydrolase OARD1-like isoform X3 n=1 Tax=Hypanus sabinus TaxID=79690 RepID=UPI0028C3A88F|nr:ADP-ribose glycohydrolase OARD1-like isoform X3 [Hypanus sabinus]